MSYESQFGFSGFAMSPNPNNGGGGLPQLDPWGRDQRTKQDSPDVTYGKNRINKLSELMNYYNNKSLGNSLPYGVIDQYGMMTAPALEKILNRGEARAAEQTALANAPQYFDQANQTNRSYQAQEYQQPSYTSGPQPQPRGPESFTNNPPQQQENFGQNFLRMLLNNGQGIGQGQTHTIGVRG